jgi:hypothetical protein
MIMAINVVMDLHRSNKLLAPGQQDNLYHPVTSDQGARTYGAGSKRIIRIGKCQGRTRGNNVRQGTRGNTA